MAQGEPASVRLFNFLNVDILPVGARLSKPLEQEKLKTEDKTMHIVTATEDHIGQAAKLFDLYRQFYGEPADIELATRFISQNIRDCRSTILLATDGDDIALGFTQLYPGWCSVAAAPYMTLYDLYVIADARNRGVARELMSAAEKVAREAKAIRIDLETAKDNHSAQALYEAIGYEQEREFYKYSLRLD